MKNERVKSDINRGIKMYKSSKNALLLDVRTQREFGEGHIDGSINIPVGTLQKIYDKVGDRTTPLFVYCRSGVRSAKAADILRGLGYSNVTDIGGIAGYMGEK